MEDSGQSTSGTDTDQSEAREVRLRFIQVLGGNQSFTRCLTVFLDLVMVQRVSRSCAAWVRAYTLRQFRVVSIRHYWNWPGIYWQEYRARYRALG